MNRRSFLAVVGLVPTVLVSARNHFEGGHPVGIIQDGPHAGQILVVKEGNLYAVEEVAKSAVLLNPVRSKA